MYLAAWSTNAATESLEQRIEREQLNMLYCKNITANSMPADIYSYPFDVTETGFSYCPSEKGVRRIQPAIIPFTANPIKLNQNSYFNYFDLLKLFMEEFRKKDLSPNPVEQKVFEELASEFCRFPIAASAIDYSFHSKAVNLYLLFGEDVEFSMRKEVEDVDDWVSFSISYRGQPVYIDTDRLDNLKKHLEIFLNKLNIHV